MNEIRARYLAQKILPGDYIYVPEGERLFCVYWNGRFEEVCRIHNLVALSPSKGCDLCQSWEQREMAAELVADSAKQAAGVL